MDVFPIGCSLDPVVEAATVVVVLVELAVVGRRGLVEIDEVEF